MICDSSTGVCSCKSNVDTTSNTICDTCMDGFWNISDSNPDGCQGKYFIKHMNSNIVFFSSACSCNSVGSTSQVCDKTLGNCTCTSMYLPPLCSDCTVINFHEVLRIQRCVLYRMDFSSIMMTGV